MPTPDIQTRGRDVPPFSRRNEPPGEPVARRRGRPVGSKNKPKPSFFKVDSLKNTVGKYVTFEDLDYLLATLDGTDKPELSRDLEILLTLQMKALLPQLAAEIEDGTLKRETTQRTATVKELLNLRFQLEKRNNEETKVDQRTFIQNIFLERGLDSDRLGLLLGSGATGDVVEGESRVVSGTPDNDEGGSDAAGDVSGEVLGGQEQVPSGGEE